MFINIRDMNCPQCMFNSLDAGATDRFTAAQRSLKEVAAAGANILELGYQDAEAEAFINLGMTQNTKLLYTFQIGLDNLAKLQEHRRKFEKEKRDTGTCRVLVERSGPGSCETPILISLSLSLRSKAPTCMGTAMDLRGPAWALLLASLPQTARALDRLTLANQWLTSAWGMDGINSARWRASKSTCGDSGEGRKSQQV